MKNFFCAILVVVCGAELARASDLAIESVDPNRGDITGDTLIHVRGSGFHDGCELKLGEVSCLDLRIASSSDLFCRTPLVSGPADVDVAVRCAGDRAVLKSGFHYHDPLQFVSLPKGLYDAKEFQLAVAGGIPPYRFFSGDGQVHLCGIQVDTGTGVCHLQGYGSGVEHFTVIDNAGVEIKIGLPVVRPLSCKSDPIAAPGKRNRFYCQSGLEPLRYSILQGSGELISEENNHYFKPALTPGLAIVRIEDEMGGRVDLEFRIPKSGYLDPRWGEAGQISVGALEKPLLASWNGMALVGTSKSGYSPGWPEIWRIRGDGTIDASYGKDGIAQIDSENPVTVATAMAVEDDGSVMLAGSTFWSSLFTDGSEVRIVKVLPSGGRDMSFGEKNGDTRLRPRKANTATSIVIRPDGRIWIGLRSAKDFSDEYGVAVMALLDQNGNEIKPSGKSGKTRIELSPSAPAFSLVGDEAGGVFAYVQDNTGPAIIHVASDGTFLARQNGIPSQDSVPWSDCKTGELALSKDRLFASWSCAIQGTYYDRSVHGAMFRRGDLSLDGTFGEAGALPNRQKVLRSVSQPWTRFQEDGKLLITLGSSEVSAQGSRKGVARFTSDGRLDTQFGADGVCLGEIPEGPIVLDGVGGFFQAVEGRLSRGQL